MNSISVSSGSVGPEPPPSEFKGFEDSKEVMGNQDVENLFESLPDWKREFFESEMNYVDVSWSELNSLSSNGLSSLAKYFREISEAEDKEGLKSLDLRNKLKKLSWEES